MTEEEAKTKWCHATSYRNLCDAIDREPANAGDPLNASRCIASCCMAWRWSEAKRSAAFLEAVQARMQAQTKPNFNTATQEVYAESGGQFERVEGFCGLAGGDR